ncbi:MAG: hypothetical protein CMG71_01230 [Candidatus Marinimicrobia bacterium]|nr:hypothetical protein [Candidatus Neomarinimicrobiota bacterium]|tara:strand:- start:26447 stop:27229 length:783 start_codon:yes stop_codon:yes gene_type:complete
MGSYNSISVIIPALNEEENIENSVENVLESFRKLQINGEVVIVNDGSTDNTENIADRCVEKYPNVQSINHIKPQGVGKAYWDGLKASKGECVTWVPADGENDAFEILRYLPLMNQVDIIIPYVYNKETRSWNRRLLSKVYKAIINLSFGMILNYMNGTVIFRKSILKDVKLKSGGFFFQTELLIKTIKQGYLYAEVPYALSLRDSGQSKALSFKSLCKVMFGYIGMFFSVYLYNSKNTDIHSDSLTWKRKALLSQKASST